MRRQRHATNALCVFSWSDIEFHMYLMFSCTSMLEFLERTPSRFSQNTNTAFDETNVEHVNDNKNQPATKYTQTARSRKQQRLQEQNNAQSLLQCPQRKVSLLLLRSRAHRIRPFPLVFRETRRFRRWKFLWISRRRSWGVRNRQTISVDWFFGYLEKLIPKLARISGS